MSGISIYELVIACIKTDIMLARESGVILEYSDDSIDMGAGKCVLGDEFKLKQVIRRLISNGVKYTPSGRKVVVRVNQIQHGMSSSGGIEMIRLTVTDGGPGISKENQRRLFEVNVQFNTSELKDVGGSSLGLWISKKIVNNHRGFIGVESEGNGDGCMFFMELPVVYDVSDKTAELYALRRADSTSKLSYLDTTATHGIDSNSMSGMRFLIVDDAKVIRKMVKAVLCPHGIIIDEACDGLEAIGIMKMALEEEHAFDAILIDSHMSVMHGPQTASELRKIGFTGKIYGMVACKNDLYTTADFMMHGVDKVFEKPITEYCLRSIFEDIAEERFTSSQSKQAEDLRVSEDIPDIVLASSSEKIITKRFRIPFLPKGLSESALKTMRVPREIAQDHDSEHEGIKKSSVKIKRAFC